MGPNVPYATFLDDFLNNQIITLSLCIIESVVSFRINPHNRHAHDMIENWILIVLCIGWTAYFLFAVFVMPARRTSWNRIINRNAETPNIELNGNSFDPIIPKSARE